MAAEKGNEYWKLAQNIGRNPTFEDPQELIKAVNEYMQHVQDNPIVVERLFNQGKEGIARENENKLRPFTMQGLASHIGVTMKTLENYAKLPTEHEHAEDFLRIITRVRELFFSQKFEGAAVGLFQHNIIARELGLEDKKRIVDKPKQVVEVLIIDGPQDQDKPVNE